MRDHGSGRVTALHGCPDRGRTLEGKHTHTQNGKSSSS